MTALDSFSRGIKYTNSPIEEGYAKLLVNYDFKNDGEAITPRGGLSTIDDNYLYSFVAANHKDFIVVATGGTYVEDNNTGNNKYMYYAIVGPVTDDGCPSNSLTCVFYESADTIADAKVGVNTSDNVYIKLHAQRDNIHRIQFDGASALGRTGVTASVNGNSYFLCTANDVTSLYTLQAYITEGSDSISWKLVAVTADEINPAQAVNYGYNMLKSAPYTFANSVGASLQLYGVIPYDTAGNLILSARAGATIVFKLNYSYVETVTSKLRVQWEIQDLDTGNDAVVIQRWTSSPQYDNGAEISLTYTPTCKRFSLICKVYYQDDIDDQQEQWDENENLQALSTRDDYPVPEQVTILASYTLSDDTKASSKNMDAKNYDLGTATGMCHWEQRLVVWGVENAKNCVFISDINNPNYFPFPNNCEILQEDIIGCVPYKHTLLIFTAGNLYQMSVGDDGLSFSNKCVQQRIKMSEFDIDTIITVQNMIYFMSDNAMYLMVPSFNNLGEAELNVAPISRPVEYALNNFEQFCRDTLTAVWGLYTLDTLNIFDYYVYQDGNHIRNTYKLYIEGWKDGKHFHTYADFCLNYDTVLRSWTTYLYQSTPYRLTMYNSTQTGRSSLLLPKQDGVKYYYTLVQFNPLSTADTVNLGTSNDITLKNWQYLDTGSPMLSLDLKKRFRELQFCVKIDEREQLEFYTGFIVDGTHKDDIYSYEVQQCTDPNDPCFGQIIVDAVPVDVDATPDYMRFNSWKFDTDTFEQVPVYKIRCRESGKGYNCSVQLLSKNEVPYELLHVNLVYREMFAR